MHVARASHLLLENPPKLKKLLFPVRGPILYHVDVLWSDLPVIRFDSLLLYYYASDLDGDGHGFSWVYGTNPTSIMRRSERASPFYLYLSSDCNSPLSISISLSAPYPPLISSLPGYIRKEYRSGKLKLCSKLDMMCHLLIIKCDSRQTILYSLDKNYMLHSLIFLVKFSKVYIF